MPTSVPQQLFMVLHNHNVQTLHALLETHKQNYPKSVRQQAGFMELCAWLQTLTVTLADIMHCSGVFAPEWGLLRIALLCNTTDAKSDPNDFFNSWKLGKDYAFVRSRWAGFEAFLTRHDLWATAVNFEVTSIVESRKKSKKNKGRNLKKAHKGIPVGQSAPYVSVISDKPLPSPPNDLSCPC
jgi:hypothetical protein